MIEMEVRVDDEVDLAGISLNRFEACADLLAGPKADTKQPGKPRAEPSSRVELAIGVQPCVESARPFGCSIRKTGIGTVGRVLSLSEIDRGGIAAAQENPDVLARSGLITTRNKCCKGGSASGLGNYP
jgi:hypothetical protein